MSKKKDKRFLTKDSKITYGDISTAPESCSRLAVMVSPAVVNIRTVRITKGGIRVFCT